jgi:DNA-binding transcriptional MerR regulator
VTANARELRIGELASAAGVSVDALRYYERLGLLTPSARTEGGFRTYNSASVARLDFIKQAQRLGLQLSEVKELIQPATARDRTRCEKVRAVIIRRLQDVERQMSELRRFKHTLEGALRNCDRTLEGGATDDCPVVKSLEAPRRRSAS